MQKQELYEGPNHAVDGKVIRAHKVILAANLKYFETMFSSDSFQESQDGVITMESVEKADLELFVSYAYTGEILLTEDNALNLLELANYLSEDDIKKACAEFSEKHLKAEEACRAYKFADTIECLSLKNAAEAKIISNFGVCSKSVDYLNFNSESLMDILADGKAQSIQMQKLLFEGIMRWILHNARVRKDCLEDLLSSIDITKFNADDITSCLYKNLVHRDDEYGITKDVIFYYEANKIRRETDQEQVLMMIDDGGSFQFYNFIEKKWFSRQEVPDAVGNIHPSNAVLNDKLYYTRINSGGNLLQCFDPSSKQVTRLHSSSPTLTYAALCACSRFLYICGGSSDVGLKSDQILRYDPQTKSFQTLTPMEIKRSSAAAIFYQGCLLVLGGYDGSSVLRSVEKYDPVRNEWTILAPMCTKRRGHAVAILDGKLYACGGFSGTWDESSVEVYDSATNRWQLVAGMNKSRDYFQVIAHEGKLLAIGGEGESTVEVYDPIKDQWQMDHEMSTGQQVGCRAGVLIPSSCIMNAR